MQALVRSLIILEVKVEVSLRCSGEMWGKESSVRDVVVASQISLRRQTRKMWAKKKKKNSEINKERTKKYKRIY